MCGWLFFSLRTTRRLRSSVNRGRIALTVDVVASGRLRILNISLPADKYKPPKSLDLQIFDRTLDLLPAFVRDVRVDLGGAAAAVAEELLDVAEIDAFFQ